MKRLVLDFETRSACDIRKAGAWRYSEDPTTQIICLSFRMDARGPVVRWEPIRLGTLPPQELYDYARDPSVIFEAHNASFEQAIWANLMVARYGLPPVPVERWDDTQAQALHRGLPAALEKVSEVLGTQKDMEGNRLLQKMSKPRKPRKDEKKADPDWGQKLWWHETPEELERLALYCDRDVEAEEYIGQSTGPLPPGERKIWELDQRINQRGVLLDDKAIRSAKRIMRVVQGRIDAELSKLTGGEVTTPNQTDRMTAWVERRCGKAPSDWRAETVDRGVKSQYLKAHYPDIHRLFELRKAGSKSSTSKLDAMLACQCSDGRARYLLQYQGAATTGRWAGRLIQPQNFPRGELGYDGADLIRAIRQEDPDLLELMYGDPAQVVSDALRPMMVAARGHEMVAGDFAAIEARVVLALAEQWDKVKMLREGRDVYCDMASQIFGYPVTDKKTHPEERQVGKAAVLGLGFQCGSATFQEQFCPDRPLEFCETVVQTYRRQWAPNVSRLWEGLESAAVDACFNNRRREFAGVAYEMEGDWLTARLPSGRKLYYHGAHCALRSMPWDPDDRRLGLFYYAFKYGKWRKVSTYGGHLAENVVQAVARDIMANAMLNADKAGAPIILTVHDEVVAEPKAGAFDAAMFEDIMENSQPKWVEQFGIPVAAEAWVGERYQK